MSVYRHLGAWKHGDVTVVRFGEHRILDELAVTRINDESNEVADRTDDLVLHFAGVVGLSSMMLGRLLTLQQKIVSQGGKLTLCEIKPEVQEVFTTTKLNHLLDSRESEDDAIRAFVSDTDASCQ
jgi:anti-anti-sigma factor